MPGKDADRRLTSLTPIYQRRVVINGAAVDVCLRLLAMYAKPDTVTLTVLLFALGTLLTATLNVMLG